MPIDFLRKIEHAQFPWTVTNSREISDVEILRGECMVVAAISRLPGSRQAIVLRITDEGRAMLARHR